MRADEFTQWTAPPSERPLCGLDAAAIDAELQQKTRADTQLRLHMGELLDALFIAHGHHELGFSSIGAHGRERTGENARWCHETRRLTRRLREGDLRRALMGAAGDPTQPPERRARRRTVSAGELAMLHTSRMRGVARGSGAPVCRTAHVAAARVQKSPCICRGSAESVPFYARASSHPRPPPQASSVARQSPAKRENRHRGRAARRSCAGTVVGDDPRGGVDRASAGADLQMPARGDLAGADHVVFRSPRLAFSSRARGSGGSGGG